MYTSKNKKEKECLTCTYAVSRTDYISAYNLSDRTFTSMSTIKVRLSVCPS